MSFATIGTVRNRLSLTNSTPYIFKEHKTKLNRYQKFLVAKRDLLLQKFLKSLCKYDALIIDDIGYVQQSREEMEVLFTLLAYRYERGSIMLTSNLPFSKWEIIFKDAMTTAAAIDRLVHHSVILELNLSSYRLAESKNGKKVVCD